MAKQHAVDTLEMLVIHVVLQLRRQGGIALSQGGGEVLRRGSGRLTLKILGVD